MSKKTASILEKIQKLEERKLQLLAKRHKELLDIFTKCNAITIDDKLLAEFLLFTMNQKNKDHPTFKEFKEVIKSTKMPSRSKS